jgi:hypothetical protein
VPFEEIPDLITDLKAFHRKWKTLVTKANAKAAQSHPARGDSLVLGVDRRRLQLLPREGPERSARESKEDCRLNYPGSQSFNSPKGRPLWSPLSRRQVGWRLPVKIIHYFLNGQRFKYLGRRPDPFTPGETRDLEGNLFRVGSYGTVRSSGNFWVTAEFDEHYGLYSIKTSAIEVSNGLSIVLDWLNDV